MQLTAELFDEITNTLRSDTYARRAFDKRSAPRVGLRTRVTIIPSQSPDGAEPVSVWLRDLSASGVGFTFGEELSEAAPFIARLPTARGSMLLVLYEVAYCRRAAKGLFTVGGKMKSILEEQSPSIAEKAPTTASPGSRPSLAARRGR